VFSDNLQPLSDMMNHLFTRLEPQREFLVKQNFGALKPTLLCLHQIFVLMQKAASNFMDEYQMLYKEVMNRLSEIKREQRYYPIYYLASLIEQRLQRIANGESGTALMGAFRRSVSGAKALLSASNFVVKALKLEIDLDALNRAIEEATKAIKPYSLLKNKWYDSVSRLNSISLKCLLDQDTFNEFCREAEKLLKQNPLRHFQKEAVNAVHYSVIGQFQFLAVESESLEIRGQSLEWLLDKAERCELNGFANSVEILEALLDALEGIYHSVTDAEREQIEVSIETMTATETKKLQDCYYAWLGGLSLKMRLGNAIQSDEPADSDLLFDEVKREMAVFVVKEIDSIKEELKAHYINPDFAEVTPD